MVDLKSKYSGYTNFCYYLISYDLIKLNIYTNEHALKHTFSHTFTDLLFMNHKLSYLLCSLQDFSELFTINYII